MKYSFKISELEADQNIETMVQSFWRGSAAGGSTGSACTFRAANSGVMLSPASFVL
jgi:hypothetical protein